MLLLEVEGQGKVTVGPRKSCYGASNTLNSLSLYLLSFMVLCIAINHDFF